MSISVICKSAVLYSFYCSVCLDLASDHRPDHTLCVGCDALEREVERRRLEAAEREVIRLRDEVHQLKRAIADEPTADLIPDAPEELCATGT